ncbi:MAG: phenylalanine--tRNA ligase subunit beta [bacterium]|nr:phenylalanine--tRNA ligase subunit beta [bacterium]MDE0418500.1 phenylalanine--tRNA ligase subunit beta [bacterium]
MKLTLAWLKRHLETSAALDEIVATLNRIGLEVEGIEDRSRELAPFTAARVTSAEPHPNAERLRVCLVETAGAEVQVVCGAPNARAGMMGVFAASGSHIPGTGLDLKNTVIRGVESRGMLCSERELGLSDEHQGIIELPGQTPVGASFAAVAGLDDPVVDLSVTPDRGDCFSVRGIARDLAAAGVGKLLPLDTAPWPGTYESPLAIELDFAPGTQDACPAFLGRHFRGLVNGPSPEWMRRKLEAVGLRPITALVDITNWLTLDIGRPAHIYDARKVSGPIGARLARQGESFEALNGKAYETDGEMTVIFDSSGMLGLGGVIGGAGTGADETTSEGFLEIALFDPLRTAATGRKLNLVSDARQRFERGIDNAFAPASMEIATRLILEICGGEASHVVTAGSVPISRQVMDVRPSRVRSLGGIDIPASRASAILGDLGFAVREAGEDAWSVTVPSWRHDMECEPDVIEEILRIHGFDEIPMATLPRPGGIPRDALSAGQKRLRRARRVLAGRGLDEAVTYSFIASARARLFGGGNDGLELVNPISSDMSAMRPSLIPGLLEAAARNQARGLRDPGLFEIGPVYHSVQDQKTAIAGLRTGRTGPRHWSGGHREVDAFDAKADAVAVLDAVGVPVDRLDATADAETWYHPGRSGILRLGPNALASFGEVHPEILRSLDVAGPAVVFELHLEALPRPRTRSPARPDLHLSRFQPVRRDFAFLVDPDVTASRLLRAITGTARSLIREVEVFDRYTGSGIADGKVSLAVAVTFQPEEASLTENEIEALSGRIVEAVRKRTGGTLRAQ